MEAAKIRPAVKTTIRTALLFLVKTANQLSHPHLGPPKNERPPIPLPPPAENCPGDLPPPRGRGAAIDPERRDKNSKKLHINRDCLRQKKIEKRIMLLM